LRFSLSYTRRERRERNFFYIFGRVVHHLPHTASDKMGATGCGYKERKDERIFTRQVVQPPGITPADNKMEKVQFIGLLWGFVPSNEGSTG